MRRKAVILTGVFAFMAVAFAFWLWREDAPQGIGMGGSRLYCSLTEEDLLNTEPFTLTYRIGHGGDQCVVWISSSGDAKVLQKDSGLDLADFQIPATYRVPSGSVGRLRRLILDNDILKLNREYRSEIIDGLQVVVTIAVGNPISDLGESKHVIYCDNFFPDGIIRLHEALSADFIPKGFRFPQLFF